MQWYYSKNGTQLGPVEEVELRAKLEARGDIQGAMAASASAKTWCMVAGGIGLAFVVMWILFVGLSTIVSH